MPRCMNRSGLNPQHCVAAEYPCSAPPRRRQVFGYHGPMGFRRLRFAFLVLAVLVWAAGCRAGEPWVEVGGARFYVEIADDDSSRTRGLMFRDSLAENRGMLFVWREAAPRAFWMRNTRIALDIIYIDAEQKIVSIAADTQPCRVRDCPSYPSAGPARYVLEINAGLSETLGLRPGDPVRFGNLPDY